MVVADSQVRPAYHHLDVVGRGHDGTALVDTNTTALYLLDLRRKRKFSGCMLNPNKVVFQVGGRAHSI
jgi:hypothetical protein